MAESGSYWSRWDLHVHTPCSYVQSYGGDTEEAWDRFLDDLEALPQEVTVLGINDYMSVEGYRRVCAARTTGRLQNIRLVLPVVEFRLARFAGQEHWQRVNMHVVFSDQVDPLAIEQELLTSLNSSYTLADGDTWSGPPLPDRLEDLGRRIKACAPAGATFPTDLMTGFNSFNVEPSDIKNLLARTDAFRGRHLTAVGIVEWDALRWTGSPAEKRSIVNSVDFLFTAGPSQDSFQKSRSKLEESTVQSRLLHCSDAHHLSTSPEPDRIGRSMTWIKAMPSFDGLMLARHEYQQRVFVGAEPPELINVREMPTKYLRSVAFQRTSGSGAPWFDGAGVDLNAGLVAIIGNKGSGKSALTDAIALAAETDAEEYLSFLSAKRFRQPRTGSAHEFECQIVWQSGDTESKNLGSATEIEQPERVRYLPQNYFERLCSDVGDDSYEEFEAELKRVVFSWLPADQRLGKATLDDLIESTTSEWRERHRLRASELSEVNRHIAGLERELQPATERELRNQLSVRKGELSAHDANSVPAVEPGDEHAAAPEDVAVLAELEEISVATTALQERQTIVGEELAERRIARQLAHEVEQRLANIVLYVDQQLRSEEASTALAVLGLDPDALLDLRVSRGPLAAKTAELDTAIAENVADLEQLGQALNEQAARRSALLQQLDDHERALRESDAAQRKWEQQRAAIVGDDTTAGSLRFLEAAIAALPEKTLQLQALEAQRDQLVQQVFDDLANLRDSYRRLFAPVQQYLAAEPLLTDGLTMTVDALIRDDGFTQDFLAHIDQSKSGAFFQSGEATVRDLIARSDFDDSESALDFAHAVVEALRPMKDGRPAGDVDRQLRGRTDREAIYDLVFSFGYLRPHYALKFNGKEIAQLSPGERGAALLIFYVLVDKSNLPILLDQPEENLDNETVSRLLVPAIREAKKRRQVIIVTHNPNLAVYCDADQVVLAELDRGTDARITYRSGAIEEVETRKWLVNVLEGTGPAFLKRHAKYSIGVDGQLVFLDH